MNNRNQIFDEHYEDYRTRLATVDISSVSERLGLIPDSAGKFVLPFFTEEFLISPSEGIQTCNGEMPSYLQFVIMVRYLLNCPDEDHEDNNWVSFKDFKMVSHFTNVNYFNSDTEAAIAKNFSGLLPELKEAGSALGGKSSSDDFPYDLALEFTALPKISLLLLFNDKDEDFPAACTVLFPKHAEWYLDPEALAITSAHLARRLRNEI